MTSLEWTMLGVGGMAALGVAIFLTLLADPPPRTGAEVALALMIRVLVAFTALAIGAASWWAFVGR